MKSANSITASQLRTQATDPAAGSPASQARAAALPHPKFGHVLAPGYVAPSLTRLFAAMVAFGFLFYANLNMGAMATRLYELPLAPNPIVFSVAAVLVAFLVQPSRRMTGDYFLAAWGFWTCYAVFGFVNMGDAALREVLQNVLKLWIAVIGVPWVMLRGLRPASIGKVIQLFKVCCLVGAVLAFLQFLSPYRFEEIMAAVHRPSGLWVNPNACGTYLGAALIVSLDFPLRNRPTELALRAMLGVGMLVTFSRCAILGILPAIFLHCILRKDYRSATLLAALLTTLFVGAVMLESRLDDGQHRRLQTVTSLLSGDTEAIREADNRTEVWRQAWDAVSRSWFFGVGHENMDHIADVHGGMGAHNLYLMVWGNSGILAALGLVWFLFVVFRLNAAHRIKAVRTCSMALICFLFINSLFSHTLLHDMTIGPVLGILVLLAEGSRQTNAKLRQGS